jgi:hypothetical protein
MHTSSMYTERTAQQDESSNLCGTRLVPSDNDQCGITNAVEQYTSHPIFDMVELHQRIHAFRADQGEIMCHRSMDETIGRSLNSRKAAQPSDGRQRRSSNVLSSSDNALRRGRNRDIEDTRGPGGWMSSWRICICRRQHLATAYIPRTCHGHVWTYPCAPST